MNIFQIFSELSRKPSRNAYLDLYRQKEEYKRRHRLRGGGIPQPPCGHTPPPECCPPIQYQCKPAYICTPPVVLPPLDLSCSGDSPPSGCHPCPSESHDPSTKCQQYPKSLKVVPKSSSRQTCQSFKSSSSRQSCPPELQQKCVFPSCHDGNCATMSDHGLKESLPRITVKIIPTNPESEKISISMEGNKVDEIRQQILESIQQAKEIKEKIVNIDECTNREDLLKLYAQLKLKILLLVQQARGQIKPGEIDCTFGSIMFPNYEQSQELTVRSPQNESANLETTKMKYEKFRNTFLRLRDLQNQIDEKKGNKRDAQETEMMQNMLQSFFKNRRSLLEQQKEMGTCR